MTTETTAVHWTKSIRDESAPCGASFDEPGIAATTKRYAVTCPACLTAMGEPASAPKISPSAPEPAEAVTTHDAAVEVSKTTTRVQTDPVANPGISRGRGAGGTEPRVISGLDAVAATPEPAREAVPGHATNDFGDCQPWCQGCEWRTRRGLPTDWEPAAPPARPSRVEVGHAWRVGRKLGRTLYRDGECVGIVDTPELAEQIVAALGTVPVPADPFAMPHRTVEELAKKVEAVCAKAAATVEALSASRTVPAPVSAPRGLTAGEESALNAAKQYTGPSVGCGAPGQSTPAETPAPPGPVKPWRPTCDTPGCGRPIPVGGEGDPEICPKCLREEEAEKAARYAAAPAPGVGEGPRELTFAEACETPAGTVQHRWSENCTWSTFHPDSAMLCAPRSLALSQFRRRPESLPVPGPRVSRVAKMVREEAGFFEGNGNTFPLVSVEQAEAIAKRVVGATLDVVRDEVRPLLGSGVDPALDRARAAMLEPKS